MTEENKFRYAELSNFIGFNEVEFINVEAFVDFAEKNKVTFVFKSNSDNIDYFLLILGNIIYKIKGKGYITLEDYKNGEINKFPDSITYYEARKGGFASYSEFEESKKVGVEEKDIFLKAKRSGFIDGYEKFISNYNQMLENPHIKGLDRDINSALKLFKFAIRKGFENYFIFSQALENGFTDFLTYTEAKSKGFVNASDYYSAVRTGFDNYKEFIDAYKLGIYTKKEYNFYLNFKKSIKDNLKHDEFQLIEILKNIENGKILSLDEIKSLLQTAQEKYKRNSSNDNTKIIPLWYKIGLDTDPYLKKFLKENSKIKKLGFFDPEKDTFEIFQISKEKIYIDASNVAFNSLEREKHKPKFRNIKYVVNELKSRGYKDITIIADASLRHAADDIEILDKLPKDVIYIESPAQTSADEFLIDNAKNDKCFIVTNDTFKDWKIKDRWIANNIDFLRVPFMIKDTRVKLVGLDKTEEE